MFGCQGNTISLREKLSKRFRNLQFALYQIEDSIAPTEKICLFVSIIINDHIMLDIYLYEIKKHNSTKGMKNIRLDEQIIMKIKFFDRDIFK